MSSELLNFDSWSAPDLATVAQAFTESAQSDKKRKKKRVSWRHFSNKLPPVKVYCYLKARFGDPNGISILFKDLNSADNLIHWHYSINSGTIYIHFFGHSSGMEIMVESDSYDATAADRELFIQAMIGQFKAYGKKMKEIQQTFEHWSLFLNTYARLYQTAHKLIEDMERIDLTEPEEINNYSSDDERKIYYINLEQWISNTTKAAAIGTALKMIYPVLAESFVNLVIYTFRKKEYKDETLYKDLLRDQIHIRVQTLHLHCDNFTGAITSSDERFKKFHTLMNGRNDFLHGNVDPAKSKLDDMFFDNRYTPLHNDDGGIIKRMMAKYLVGISLKEVQNDEIVVNEFIAMLLEKLDDKTLPFFCQIMGERFPGINKKTARLGSLLPQHYAEANVAFDNHVTEDDEYQWYVSDLGNFSISIPASWQCQRQKGKYVFRNFIGKSTEMLFLSVSDLNATELSEFYNLSSKMEIRELDENRFYQLPEKRFYSLIFNGYLFQQRDHLFEFVSVTGNVGSTKRGSEEKISLHAIEQMLGSFKITEVGAEYALLSTYRYHCITKGLAANALLKKNAKEHNSFYELVVITGNQIDTLLRVGIVMKKQLINHSNEMDDSWLYFSEDKINQSEEDVLEQARQIKVVPEDLLDDIVKHTIRRKYLLSGSILSSVSVKEVEQFWMGYEAVQEKVSNIIREIEDEQIEKKIGIGKDGFEDEFHLFAPLVKSRFANHKHFADLLLSVKKERTEKGHSAATDRSPGITI